MVAASAPLAAAPAAVADWTLLIYQDADNDLEGTSMDDLVEMAEVGSSATVNVIVLSDRAPQGEDDEDGYFNGAIGDLPDWRTAKLLRVETGNLKALADWGEVNMADPATLRRFLTTGMRDYPARRYGLFLTDHGFAWPGICYDESAAGDVLTLAEVAEVLAPFTKERKLDLIAFDACLMGSFEVAQAVAPFATAMVASEELEPATGWDYSAVLTALRKTPAQDGLALGKVIADTYMASYVTSADKADRQTAYGLTLSVVALDQIPALERSVNELAQRCSRSLTDGGRRSWLRLARARAATEEYGVDQGELGNAGAGIHDLAHLASLLSQPATSPEAAAAAAVVAGVRRAVVHNVRGKARPNSGGLSIFFPPDGTTLTTPDPIAYASTRFAKSSPWMPFLTSYAQLETGDTKDPELKPVTASNTVIPAGGTATFSSILSGADNDIERSLFFLGQHDGDKVRVLGDLASEPNAQGLLKEEWDGRWFMIGDAKHWVVAPITDFEPLDDEDTEETTEDEAKEARRDEDKVPAVQQGFGSHAEADAEDEEESEEETEGEGEGEGEEQAEEAEGQGTIEGTSTGFGNQSDGDGDGAYLVSVPGQLQRGGKTTWMDVTLYFYVDFSQDEVSGEFVSAYTEARGGAREIAVRKGDRIRPVYVLVDEEGNETASASTDPEEILQLPNGDADLTVGYEEVGAGTYQVGFHVVDFAGNITEETVSVEVE